MLKQPKVDFYILENTSMQKSWLFACQLVEKAYQEEKNVIVQLASREDTERFDELLWTYRDISFTPHESINTTIHVTRAANAKDILVNLSREIPASYQDIPQIIEIVFAEPLVQQLARERFRTYREQGCELLTHKISDETENKNVDTR